MAKAEVRAEFLGWFLTGQGALITNRVSFASASCSDRLCIFSRTVTLHDHTHTIFALHATVRALFHKVSQASNAASLSRSLSSHLQVLQEDDFLQNLQMG